MFIQCTKVSITINTSKDIYQRNVLCLFRAVVKLRISIGGCWYLMCGLLDVYTATQKKPDDECSMFHQKVHTCTKLYGVTSMEANRYVRWCENLKCWLWNCSCRITQMMTYGLFLIQETWQQIMQKKKNRQGTACSLRHTLHSNIARAIFRHKSEKLLQKKQLPDYTALGPRSQQQWCNLVFRRPGWIITMAAQNRNYKFNKSVIYYWVLKIIFLI